MEIKYNEGEFKVKDYSVQFRNQSCVLIAIQLSASHFQFVTNDYFTIPRVVIWNKNMPSTDVEETTEIEFPELVGYSFWASEKLGLVLYLTLFTD